MRKNGKRVGVREVPHIEERLGHLLLEDHPEIYEPPALTRAGGHLLLWTMAALICYAAAM
jgi:hypothetical protein